MGLYGSQKISKMFNNPDIKGETAKYLAMMQNKIVQRVKVDRNKDKEDAKKIQDFLNVLKNTNTQEEMNNILLLMQADALNQLMNSKGFSKLFSEAYDVEKTKGKE